MANESSCIINLERIAKPGRLKPPPRMLRRAPAVLLKPWQSSHHQEFMFYPSPYFFFLFLIFFFFSWTSIIKEGNRSPLHAPSLPHVTSGSLPLGSQFTLRLILRGRAGRGGGRSASGNFDSEDKPRNFVSKKTRL